MVFVFASSSDGKLRRKIKNQICWSDKWAIYNVVLDQSAESLSRWLDEEFATNKGGEVRSEKTHSRKEHRPAWFEKRNGECSAPPSSFEPGPVFLCLQPALVISGAVVESDKKIWWHLLVTSFGVMFWWHFLVTSSGGIFWWNLLVTPSGDIFRCQKTPACSFSCPMTHRSLQLPNYFEKFLFWMITNMLHQFKSCWKLVETGGKLVQR